MPACEAAQHEADDAAEDCEQDCVDDHDALVHALVVKDRGPDPLRGDTEADPAEERGVGQEEQEGFVVVHADAGGKPGAVVVHLQHAAVAGAAMVGAIRLHGLAFLAVPSLAV